MKNEFYIELLRTKVSDTFSKTLSINSSQDLSNEIFEKTGECISATTIQRFFELVSNTSYPSKFTLNILSDYAGFQDWETFKSNFNEELPCTTKNIVSPDEFGIELFSICLKNKDYDSVFEYLDLLPEEGIEFEKRHKIADALGKTIRHDKKSRNYLLKRLAKSHNGRIYFYETFVDIDYLNVYYSDALNNYYLKSQNSFNKKNVNSDTTFAKSIKFISDLKSGHKKKAIYTANELLSKVSINTHWSEFGHPFPYARMLSVYIIQLYLQKKLTTKHIEFCISKIEKTIPSLDPTAATFVLSKLIIALNYCERYGDVIALYDKYRETISKSIKSTHEFIPIMLCYENSCRRMNILNDCITENNFVQFLCNEISLDEKTPIL